MDKRFPIAGAVGSAAIAAALLYGSRRREKKGPTRPEPIPADPQPANLKPESD